MHKWIVFLVVFLVLFSVSSSSAFVERLTPNVLSGDSIPCHAIGAAMLSYIRGSYTAPQVGDALRDNFLCGPDKICTGGEGWTAQDVTDNGNLVTLLNSETAIDKLTTVLVIEKYCILWESKVTGFSTPNDFRTKIGIALP